MKLSLGFSPCPNDTFIFDALIHGKIDTEGLEFEVFYDDVETLNRKAFRGELDITKLSYYAFAHVISDYVLLNAGSALGFGVGPLLITAPGANISPSTNRDIPGDGNLPLAESSAQPAGLQDKMIGIPGHYTTANFLLSLAFPEAKHKKEMVFSGIEEALLKGEIDLGLIIHENRFTYEEKGLRKVMDLGEFWEKETGCPIPLGGIMVKRAIRPEIQAKADRLIRRSIEYAFANPSSGLAFIRSHAQEMDETVMYRHIELYVNKYSVDLGPEGRRAVEVLFDMAAKKGLIEPVTQPVFAAG
ncbi:1,4-dihydroxy-6-naphthoate synthase [Anseongella ginsenosidimutans]|uniref:1,4-dihydroxy-6-naphtoate synthase n=1 Tax=Anseongella ginsenosidimutans TaxID=496056 RepID=A0A4R3KWJ4_9SPHI|nr:1,4-dihydroxy-6-naphthoate synthase [Anseongella ginsenosidimutans]QEC51525.1 1,4-dihydroxy-6-naphthoate synthase [Anseongella ginsenosidimutans]TCS88840.1 1,4-dihydroxy-6-naphthoate synthase [Anseongella ginsenosidimutans]